jgi:hypothetical protein
MQVSTTKEIHLLKLAVVVGGVGGTNTQDKDTRKGTTGQTIPRPRQDHGIDKTKSLVQVVTWCTSGLWTVRQGTKTFVSSYLCLVSFSSYLPLACIVSRLVLSCLLLGSPCSLIGLALYAKILCVVLHK